MNLKNLKNIIQSRGGTKKPPGPKQLNATARRVSATASSAAPDYYEEDDEPNVRLSRAFLVVMLLHVVAVGGIFLFSSFKKDGTASLPPKQDKAQEARTETPSDSRDYVVGENETLGSIASAFGVSRADLATLNKLSPGATVHEGDNLVIPSKTTVQADPVDVKKLLNEPDKTEKEEPRQIVRTSNPPSKPVAIETTQTQPAHKAELVKSATVAKTTSDRVYVVQKGDNPVAIAKKLKVKYKDLLSANHISDPRKLQIGQKLVVPE